VFERVNREIPFDGLHWIVDHAETISPRSIDRVRALGGGIAIQHRMAFQGEYFVERYGARAAQATPPVRRMLAAGCRSGMGTDATRVASYNPWIGLSWLITGRTVGGSRIHPAQSVLDRETAIRLYTEGSAWFSTEAAARARWSRPICRPRRPRPRRDAGGGGRDPRYGIGAHHRRRPDRLGDGSLWRARPGAIAGRAVLDAGGGFMAAISIGRPPAASSLTPASRAHCGCGTACGVHGHSHAEAWTARAPAGDLRSFWGALGCACFL
jgi:hypothetical protein